MDLLCSLAFRSDEPVRVVVAGCSCTVAPLTVRPCSCNKLMVCCPTQAWDLDQLVASLDISQFGCFSEDLSCFEALVLSGAALSSKTVFQSTFDFLECESFHRHSCLIGSTGGDLRLLPAQ